MARRLRRVQQDINQGNFVGWATKEEVAARRADMDRCVREEIRIVAVHQQGEPSTRGSSPNNPILVGFVNPQYTFSHDVSGTIPPRGDPKISPLMTEAHRVTDQFCEDFCVLKAEVAILEAKNLILQRMIEDVLTPARVVPPSPPRDQA